MGTVYAAFDHALGREVAIKIGNALPSTELQARLTREARVIARLEHPGIVPVHDFGVLADGRPFYVMKRLHGRTLQECLEQAPPLPERLRIFERVCEAVSFAHAHEIIHRDLKPQNVMVGEFGEVMVMDWGVARLLGDPVEPQRRAPMTGRTSAGTSPMPATVLGTPGFMAPEQATPTAGIDRRADVYALGAMLFTLLSGQRPPSDPAAAVSELNRLNGIERPSEVDLPLRAVGGRRRTGIRPWSGSRKTSRASGRASPSACTRKARSRAPAASSAPTRRPFFWSSPTSSCVH